jgi:hypothetical protein
MAMHAVQTRPMLQQRARSVQCFASAAPKPSLARKLQQFGAAAIVTTGTAVSGCPGTVANCLRPSGECFETSAVALNIQHSKAKRT